MGKYMFLANFPSYSSNVTTSDTYNKYYYKGSFRLIIGKDSTVLSESQINSILEEANNSYDTYIKSFDYNKPVNENIFIDIYIANTNAYNGYFNKYETIGSNYAGYATYYYDNAPYFVLNYVKKSSFEQSLNILKVTIAHELFHTIQYSYGIDSVSDNMWCKDVWWLEATATMMEEMIYPEINDYTNFLPYIYNYSTLNFETFNYPQIGCYGDISGHEYGMSIYALFLVKKFGLNIIKDTFTKFDKNIDFYTAIKNLIEEMGYDFDSILKEFYYSLYNPKEFYSDYKLFPNIKISDKTSIQKSGFIYTDINLSDLNYTNDNLASNIELFMPIEEVNKTDKKYLIYAKSDISDLNKELARYFMQIKTVNGWQLFSNSFSQNFDLTIFDNAIIIWVYRDNKYIGTSSFQSIKDELKESGLLMEQDILYPFEGAWIYSQSSNNINIPSYNLSEYNTTFNNSFEIKNMFLNNNTEQNISIFGYQYNRWRVFNSDYKSYYNKLNYLMFHDGYFVRGNKSK
ncbi:MAG: hypothetical protein HXX81_00890 [Campylobacterales bacterium]|nr:hypothetical protein [Campylobacterales bacterium]